MLGFLLSIVPTLVVLGILIFIHELGHFVAAKKSGVAVEKFSLGFGPVLLKFKKKETTYAISLIPLGGFVKMAGETIEDKEEAELAPDDFISQNIFKRFLIIFSGPFMNYVLAFILLIGVCYAGKPFMAPVVGNLIENYPAAIAGIEAGDKVLKINNAPVNTWGEMSSQIVESNTDIIQVLIQREDKEIEFNLTPSVVEDKTPLGDKKQSKKLGIIPSGETILIKYSFIDSVKEATKITTQITVMTYYSLYKLVTGKLSANALSGPLGIMVITGETAKKGLIYLVQLTAFLSISLGIFNLLPIPALDGGHLLFLLLEIINKKPVSFKLQERFAQVGFALLMTLMAFVVWNDAVNFDIVGKIKSVIPFLK